MRLTKVIKTALVCGSVLGTVVWFASTRSSQAVGPVTQAKPVVTQSKPAVLATVGDAGYVGSDACKDCHEDQFKAFAHTSLAELAT